MGENPASNRAPELKLQVQTASGYTIELDLLTDKALSRFGKSTTDVRSVDWSDHFSDSVYTELGLASSHHPLIGSGSTMLGFQDGKVGEMSDIFYQDYNEARNHFRGLPHWNHERRYSMPDGSIQWDKRPEGTHIIDQADWIEISAWSSDGTRFVKKMPWVPRT